MQDTCDSSKILVTIFLDNLYQEQLLQLAHRGGEGRVLCVLTQRLKMNMRFLSRSNPAACVENSTHFCQYTDPRLRCDTRALA